MSTPLVLEPFKANVCTSLFRFCAIKAAVSLDISFIFMFKWGVFVITTTKLMLSIEMPIVMLLFLFFCPISRSNSCKLTLFLSLYQPHLSFMAPLFLVYITTKENLFLPHQHLKPTYKASLFTLFPLHLTSVCTASTSIWQAIYPIKTRHPLSYYQTRGEKID